MLPDPNYIPNPTAARILMRLIEFGHVPDPLPDLPPEWLHAFTEVKRFLAFDRHVRWREFVQATHNFPYDMVVEVNQMKEATEDWGSKNRILYTSKDALYVEREFAWLVEGLLARPSLNLLVGAPGSKKTLAALDLAICFALGQPWLGRQVRQGSVLYIDEDTGYNRFSARVRSVLKGHQADETTPFHYVCLGSYNLRDPEDAEQLTNRAFSHESGLIIIDTLAGVMRGGDENSVASVQPVLYHLRRLAEYTRSAVLLLHHTNKLGAFRGSSSISAAMDLMLEVQSPPHETLIQFTALKSRHEIPPPFAARAHFDTSPEGDPLFHLTPSDETFAEKPEMSKRTVASAILDYLVDNQEADTEQLFAHLDDVSLGTIRNTLHQLKLSGLVERSDRGNMGSKATYRLSVKGLEVLTINESPAPNDDD